MNGVTPHGFQASLLKDFTPPPWDWEEGELIDCINNFVPISLQILHNTDYAIKLRSSKIIAVNNGCITTFFQRPHSTHDRYHKIYERAGRANDAAAELRSIQHKLDEHIWDVSGKLLIRIENELKVKQDDSTETEADIPDLPETKAILDIQERYKRARLLFDTAFTKLDKHLEVLQERLEVEHEKLQAEEIERQERMIKRNPERYAHLF